jgi:hypothetical protein
MFCRTVCVLWPVGDGRAAARQYSRVTPSRSWLLLGRVHMPRFI